jgi:translation initiation factor 4G
VLSSIKVPSNSDPSKMANFRTMLLTKCQKEFDTDFYSEINYDKLKSEVEACTDEAKRKELQELADDKLSKAKRRSLGNIRFIGELFKLNMLTEGIMNDCIERLLKQESDEENIECLCRLLTTIGKEVDKPNNSAKMKVYFEKLDKIVKKKDCVTARIRFMILDVIELRGNKWVPRRKDNNPRRIEEIRREAEEDQQRIADEIAKNQANEKRNMQGQMGQKGGQKGGQQYQQQGSLKSTSMDSESFNMRSNKAQTGNMVNKIKEVKQITTTKLGTEMLLGPGGGQSFAWNKPKPSTSDSTTAVSNTSSSTNTSSSITASASFSTPKTSSGSSGSTQSMSGQSNYANKNKQNFSDTTSRLSMDSNKSNFINIFALFLT